MTAQPTRPRLSLPRLDVHLPAGADTDPTAATVQTTAADAIRWDQTRARHGWPSADDAPFLWLSFMAWAALRRTGAYTGKWEQFAETVEAVETTAQPDVDPTRPDQSDD